MSEINQDSRHGNGGLSPTVKFALTLIQGFLPPAAAVVGGLWVAFTYMNNERRNEKAQAAQAAQDSIARFIEARKPYLAKQLELYDQAAQTAGKLVSTTDITSAEWQANFRDYEGLYWGELNLVESKKVKRALGPFESKLHSIEENAAKVTAVDLDQLRTLSSESAHSLRSAIEKSWNLPEEKE